MPGKAQDRNAEPAETTNGTVVQATPFQRMIATMEMEATAAIEENAQFAGDDLSPLLTAESEAEIWEADERGPLNFQHLAGCDIEILDVQVKYSRGGQSQIATPFVSRDGKKMYLLVTVQRISDATDRPEIRLPKVGEPFQANTSARYVTGKIWAFYVRGNIGNGNTLRAHVRETDLGDGTAVLKLRPVTATAVQA